jgi:hypothetical protein
VNLNTNRIVFSRDVKWLNKMWGEYQKVKQEKVINIDHDDDYEFEEPASTEYPGDQIIDQGGNQVIGGAEATRASSVERELMRFSTFYNPTLPLMSDEEKAGGAESTRASRVERERMRLSKFYNPAVPLRSYEEAAKIAIMSAVESGYDEPRNFEKAWNHEDQGIRGKWQHAIQNKYRDMTC